MMQELTPEQANEWLDKFPKQLVTSYHRPYFLEAESTRHPQSKPIYLAFELDGQRFLHSALMCPIPGIEYFDLQSPFGFGGGPLWTENTSSSFFNECKKAYLEWCQKSKILAEFVRFFPLNKSKQLYFGHTIQLRPTLWVNLGQKNLIQTYTARTRTAIKETLASGIQIQWNQNTALSADFYPLYVETMKNLGSVALSKFPEAYFQILTQNNNIHYVECRMKGQLLGGALFLHHDSFFDLHLFASIFEGTQFNVLGALLHSGFLKGQELGCRMSHIGGGLGSKFGDPLYSFKTTFACKEAPYFIGTQILNKPVYEAMKTIWTEQNGQEPDRVLFYRKGI